MRDFDSKIYKELPQSDGTICKHCQKHVNVCIENKSKIRPYPFFNNTRFESPVTHVFIFLAHIHLDFC